MNNLKLDAEWVIIHESIDKPQTYNGNILCIKSTYHPCLEQIQGNTYKLAHSILFINHKNLCLAYGEREGVLAEKDFYGDSFDEISSKVEQWAQEQMNKAVDFLRKGFNIK